MTELCTAANLPVPVITSQGSDFWITFRKDIYNANDLSQLGLSERQIKAVLYVKENGKITNSEYQELNKCSRNTASSELSNLVDKSILQSSDVKGAGSFYQIAQIAQ